jgi:fatty acid desaturase
MLLDSSAARRSSIEWPTVALVAALYAAWLALTWFHEALPLWLWLPLAGCTAAWWGSFQHETVHGHPTRSRAVNAALATPPVWLWLPFERYRALHLAHHQDERLTDPVDDPETRYWAPEAWKALGPASRLLVDLQSTLLGRLAIGPLWTIGCFAADEGRALWAGDRALRRIWAWHALWATLVAVWAFAVCGMPLWQYLAGFVYLGLALTLIRSFAEHRAAESVAHRTAIVENSRLLGPLFLFNNLHVVHHAAPAVPWYRLPRVYRENREAVLAMNGGLVYDGYGEVFRRFLLRRHDHPVHPLVVQAGTGYPAALASTSQRNVVA